MQLASYRGRVGDMIHHRQRYNGNDVIKQKKTSDDDAHNKNVTLPCHQPVSSIPNNITQHIITQHITALVWIVDRIVDGIVDSIVDNIGFSPPTYSFFDPTIERSPIHRQSKTIASEFVIP